MQKKELIMKILKSREINDSLTARIANLEQMIERENVRLQKLLEEETNQMSLTNCCPIFC